MSLVLDDDDAAFLYALARDGDEAAQQQNIRAAFEHAPLPSAYRAFFSQLPGTSRQHSHAFRYDDELILSQHAGGRQ